MDKNKIAAREIFLTAGNACLTAGVAALGTTSLPAVLPSVFVGAFCFQALQHLWAKRKQGLKMTHADLVSEKAALDVLKEVKGLESLTQSHFNQIEQGMTWMCKALDTLGEKVNILEKKSLDQEGEIGHLLSITFSHEEAIEVLEETIRSLNPPINVKDSLTEGAALSPYIDYGKLYKAITENDGIFEGVRGLLQIPTRIMPGGSANITTRANALLDWAKGQSGPGLGEVYLAYKEIASPPH